MVFMGEELGLEGFDNEGARQPMPWDGRGWDRTTLEAYGSLIRLRRGHVALRRGGFRWAHVGADALVYLREHPDERLLVWLSRAAHEPVRLPADGLAAGRAVSLLGDDDLLAAGGVLELPRHGPAYGVWSLEP
jgi:alpha-glucosidase